MKIIIARHGQTDGNASGLIDGKSDRAKLTEKGKKHSQTLIDFFKSEGIDAIFSSPLKRAINTAKPLAKSLNLPLKIDKRIIEMDFGDIDRKPIEKNRNKIRLSELDLHKNLPGGESYAGMMKRVKPFVKDIMSKNFKIILIVAHHRVNTALLTAFLDLKFSKHPQQYSKIAQKNEIVYIIDTDKKTVDWINTLNNKKGKGLIYKKF